MMITHTIETGLSGIILALTPTERWAATKNLNTDPASIRWFILIGGGALTILAISIIVATYKQRIQRSKSIHNNSVKQGGKRQR